MADSTKNGNNQFEELLDLIINSNPIIVHSKSKMEFPKISAEDTNQEKRDALIRALNMIARLENDSALSSADVSNSVAFFEALYGGSKPYRHLYSDISHTMYSFLKDDSEHLDNGVPYQARTLANNIEMLSNKIDDSSSVDESIKRCVRKLYDHIELENTRMSYMMQQNKALNDNATKIIETQNSLQRNYVTILGIFAAIVIAFVTGMSFTSSVLQNIANASMYRLSFTMVFIALFMLDLVASLYYFICRVSKLQEEGKGLPWTIITFNIIGVVLIIAIVIVWWFGIRIP